MEPIHIVIPGEPVAQGRVRFSTQHGHVRAYDPPKSRAYKLYVCNYVKRQKPTMLTGAICMLAVFYKSVPKSWPKKKRAEALAMELMPMERPDADNYLKALKDALNGVLYKDDSNIILPIPFKAYSDEPRVELFMASNINWLSALGALQKIVRSEEDGICQN